MSSTKAGGRNSARWFGGWRRQARARQPDFADFGTAFGLDLSLGQMAADEASRPAAAPRPPAPAKGWRQRWTRRRAA